MALSQKLTWACFFVFLVLFHIANAQSPPVFPGQNWYQSLSIPIGSLLLLTAIFAHQYRRILRQNKLLKKEVKEHLGKLDSAKQREHKVKVEAETAARTKSQFLANMSHEIRTPMNGILGMAELLSHEKLPPEHRNYVEIILKSGESLLSIINDILDFSKIESGKLELDKYPVNLVECVEEVLSLLSGKTGQKPLELLYEIEEGLPEEVLTDGLRLRQILLNLVGNALKFTEEGEICICMRLAHPLKDKGQVRINFTVSDTGIGIPEEKQANLFDSFTQVDATTSRKYGGTGLGLTISNRLVQLMGGTLEIESKPGQGSKFYFTIEVEAIQPTKDSISLHLTGKKILLLDTNKQHAKLIQKQLQGLAIEMNIAFVDTSEIQYPSNISAYDMILFNIMCEAKELIKWTSYLREAAPSVKTVYFSPLYAFRQIKSFQLFSEVIPKPVRRKNLLAALDQLWTLRHESDSPVKEKAKPAEKNSLSAHFAG